MSKPKVLLYAPREEPKPIIDALRNAGLDVVEGDRRWQTPAVSIASRFWRRPATQSR